MRTFSVAARHATFTGAARELGVTQVAVSRQVAVLEEYLDTQLFERDVNATKLTDAGLALSHQIMPLFQEIERVATEFVDKERRQTVNLRAYPTFTHHWLVPRLPELLDTMPKFDLRLDTKVEPLDFRRGYLDLAIQLGNGQWPHARARELFPEQIDAVCSPAYRDKYLADAGETLPKDAVLLHAKYRRREWNDWAEASGMTIDNLHAYGFQSSILAYQAAKAGMGLAMGQLPLLREELDSGLLVRPFERPFATGSAFWVTWPNFASVSGVSKRLIDWLLICAGQKPEFRREP
jgi:LysR family glycine cleavage system transcriptional activator